MPHAWALESQWPSQQKQVTVVLRPCIKWDFPPAYAWTGLALLVASLRGTYLFIVSLQEQYMQHACGLTYR